MAWKRRYGAPEGRGEALERSADVLARKRPVQASGAAPKARRPYRLALQTLRSFILDKHGLRNTNLTETLLTVHFR